MPYSNPSFFTCTLGALSLFLASCGGGGGGTSDAGSVATIASVSTGSGAGSTGAASSSSGATPYVDASRIPAAKPGSSQRLIGVARNNPERDGGGIGAMRTVCDYTHFNFDDMLVFPGQVGRSHLHIYFGNTAIDANSTPESVRTSGDGSCRGGIVNRSGYWVPALIDTRSGTPLLPGTDAESMGIDIYYKTGYLGVADSAVQPIPRNFRMIAGNSKSTGSQAGANGGAQIVTWGCNDRSYGAFIPSNCGAGNWVYMSVQFPQCWDGRSLDSPDHKSHVAYAAAGRGCADSRFPVALPEVTYVVKYRVGSEGTGSWRLSSDIDGAPAGSSGHGDYVFGWEEAVFTTGILQIVNLGLSGGSDLVGGGLSIFK